MDGGLWVSESPLAPLKGGIIRVPWPVLPDIAVESPTARRFVMVIGYRLWVIERLLGTMVVDGGDAAPERPNNKIIMDNRLIIDN